MADLDLSAIVKEEADAARPHLGDGLRGLASLKAGSVGLVLSDLPSGETNAKFDRKIAGPDLPVFWSRVWRALKRGGNVVLFASSLPFAAEVIASQREHYRYDLVWSKSIKTGFLNAKHRPLRSHEFVLVFHRGRGTYNVQMQDSTVPVSSNGVKGSKGSENYGTKRLRPIQVNTRSGKLSENYDVASFAKGKSRVGATDRFPSSVLHFNSIGVRHPDRRHPQQKPEDLLRYLVRTYSNEHELVVDPFAGSGSTGVAAIAESRRFAGWDSDPRFGVADA
jgi:site-specific DNA-methyltransferase (adenine-specific)